MRNATLALVRDAPGSALLGGIRMTRRCLQVAAWVGGLVSLGVGAAPAAQAYIDPGSTTYIVQIILGAIFGAGLAIATFWRRFRDFVGRLFGRRPRDSDDAPDDAADEAAERSTTDP